MGTEDDANKIWNPLRIGFMAAVGAAVVILFALAITLLWAVITHQALPDRIGEYCTGVGVVLAGVGTLVGGTGAALWATEKGS